MLSIYSQRAPTTSEHFSDFFTCIISIDEQSLPQKEAWKVGMRFSNMKNNAQKRNMPWCSEWTQGLASENFGGLQSVQEPQNDFLSLTPVILGSQQ